LVGCDSAYLLTNRYSSKLENFPMLLTFQLHAFGL
jgi:hypothetical protein